MLFVGGAIHAAAPDAVTLNDTLCVAREGTVLRIDRSCTAVEGVAFPITLAEFDRQFLWMRGDKRAAVVGPIAKNATAIDLDATKRGTIRLALSGDKARGWPAPVELDLTVSDKHRYRIALPAENVASLTGVSAPPGVYKASISAPHHLRLHREEILVKASADTSLGALRLLAAPRVTATVVNAKGDPLPSAVLTGERGDVLAAAGADGSLAAELPADLPAFLELLADGYAPHRIPLDQEPTDLPLGRVVLRRGATLAVTLDRSGIGAAAVRVSVLTRGPDRRFRETAGHDLKPTETSVSFPPIEAGDYFLGVEGPTPLARHTEALHLPESGAVEKQLSIDPIRITGEVFIGSRRATGGQLDLQPEGGGWEVAVEVVEDGSFQTESWEKGTFSGFYMRDAAHDGTFVRDPLEAKTSPAHWHIVIPDRTLKGRIYDKDTRQAVANAGLEKEVRTDDSGTGMGIVPVQPDGSFVLDAVEPGDYTLKATAENYMPATARMHISATDTERTVELPLEPGITVVLNIVTAGGEPVARATIIDGLGDGLNPENVYTSDGAGQVTLRLKPHDKRTLYVLPREGSFAIADVNAANSAEGVRVVVPPPAGTLHVRAMAEGKPVRGVVPLFRWNGRLLPPPVPRFFPFADPFKTGIWTDESGRAEFPSMPAGVYEFFAVRSEAEEAAVARGISTITPVRVGFSGGSAEVLLELTAH
jgi:hypothetical protein